MPRMTLATRLVLGVLLSARGEMYGREVVMKTGLPSGTVQPILTRLEQAGWVRSRREGGDASALGRPVRHYWRLTPNGRVIARDAASGGIATISAKKEHQ